VFEQRKNPRHPCQFPAAVDGPRGPVRGTCTNLSLGGLFLSGIHDQLGHTTMVSVDFGAQQQLSVVGLVGRASTNPPGIGVLFERLEQAQLELLKKIIGTLPEAEGPPGPRPAPLPTANEPSRPG